MKRSRFTIRVVEDDPSDRFLIKRAIDANGVPAELRLVTCGEEAIAYLKGEGQFADREQYQYPSFLITDLKMPRGDGFSLRWTDHPIGERFKSQSHDLRACLKNGLLVAQATRLCRPATRRTGRERHFEPMGTAFLQCCPQQFRSAGRRPERADRPHHPFSKQALKKRS
jgi:hypothetical protein